ncbi:MAG: T9SS type A sorting domain-containing protein [Flavobacteriales bacterium]|nr:T9SS type A sorting domain-containing protein [Flavobacteriales bacterium]MBK7941255.1 T9SS type A sorting domain-containing protein [Flavobacteriales bacterium]MBK9701281.1 T9SS type A sorting domain-containing protein [Flavobacteriales bacterium]
MVSLTPLRCRIALLVDPPDVRRSVLLLVCLVIVGAASGQSIAAGMVGLDDHYVDVVPDTLLSELNVHLSPYPGEQFRIDLDSDGMYDARFVTYGGGGLGGGAGGCQLQPEPWVSIMAHLDTSNGCCPGQYIALLADTIRIGDTISAQDSFVQDEVYLWSGSYGWAMAPIINDWLGIGEHFIGLRMLAGIDTLYGWIRVNAFEQGPRTLVVMDHAINLGTVGISSIDPTPEVRVFPIPAEDLVTVQIPTGAPAGSVGVLDLRSRTVLRVPLTDAQATLDLSGLEAGVYFLNIRIGERTVVERLIRE